MYLTPSKILYTHRDPDINNSTERTFLEMTKTIHTGTVFPKLQVVKKDGFYFTLNDAKLQVYRHLEKLGHCGSVEVEKIALKEVPEGIRQLMKPPDRVSRFKGQATKDKNRNGKYHSVSTSAFTDVNGDESVEISKCSGDTEDGESGLSESSESELSDADLSDWSDEDISVSDTDVETSDDIEDIGDNEEDEDKSDENKSFI